MKRFIILSLLVLIAGCAYIDQNLKVEPQMSIPSTNIGHGKEILVQIVDEREEQQIGNRAGGYGFKAAKIITDQDLVEVLRQPIYYGLKQKGFQPVDNNEILPSMKVELRILAYDTCMGLWTGGNIGKATIKVMATNSSQKNFENTYRAQKEIRTAFVGSQETNSKVVNEALNEVLYKIFTDGDLFKFLTE